MQGLEGSGWLLTKDVGFNGHISRVWGVRWVASCEASRV